ncbi:MAG: tyrosine--tRNA ligase [Candidatus Marinimicrobia bacterium]|nr:tyrosine--tRNA ligase [Candidatus Neomarinimicrobiota bacterium]
MFPPINEQMDLIKKGTAEIVSEDELVKKLENSIKNNTPLRIKQGFDPTAPDIHLGHTVGIRKLKDFQSLGHQIVLIVGDYTAMVGDPSGKNSTRPRLTRQKILENAKTYEKQFFKILDQDKTEIHFNGTWFQDMRFEEIMNLAASYTVARILERDDFTKRYKAGSPISLHEFFYPLMQGYDSVAIRSDVELGATEQMFNLLAGRNIQREYGMEPQIALTMPVLEGIDGKDRMSKSTGNYIGIDEPAKEMFGKIMSIPDEIILKYFTLLSDLSVTELKDIEKKLNDPQFNPMLLKKQLGRDIITQYHNAEAARQAQEEFEAVFSKNAIPEDIEIIKLPADEIGDQLVRLLTKYNLTESNGEAKRMIKQGAVKINNDKVSDQDMELKEPGEYIIKVGKRRFVKFVI